MQIALGNMFPKFCLTLCQKGRDVGGDGVVVKNDSRPQYWKIQQTHSSSRRGIFVGKFLTSIANGIQSQHTTDEASCGSVELRFLRAVANSRTKESSRKSSK